MVARVQAAWVVCVDIDGRGMVQMKVVLQRVGGGCGLEGLVEGLGPDRLGLRDWGLVECFGFLVLALEV